MNVTVASALLAQLFFCGESTLVVVSSLTQAYRRDDVALQTDDMAG